jgi:MFS family permease
MSLISLAQVLGLLLSGYLAERLGIRPLFLASAGALALISAAGFVFMRQFGQKPPTAAAQTGA